MAKNNFKNKYTTDHHADWRICCDICGRPCWYSEATLLDTDTGHGGALVCPQDADPIDYGLVPYEIPVEEPVEITRALDIYTDPNFYAKYQPFDTGAMDPMSYSPDELQQIGKNWEELLEDNWEEMLIFNWEQLV